MIILFGASGDIHRKKVYPGLYDLFKSNICNAQNYDFKVIGVGRSDYDNSSYQNLVNNSLEKHKNYSYDSSFLENFSYIKGFYDNRSTYLNILYKLQKLNKNNKIIIYCGVPDYISLDIIKHIKLSEIYDKYSVSFLIEKPFGCSIKTYDFYTSIVKKYININDFKLIDHYKCKSSIKNMKSIENLNNKEFLNSNLKKIKITLFETVDVEHRLEYFDMVGLLNDVFQSHIMTILEKLISKEYSFLTLPKNIEDVNRGQYINYGGSKITETFVEIKLIWKDIYIFIEFGKKMKTDKKSIQFISNQDNTLELEINSDINEYCSIFNSEITNSKDDYYLSDSDNRQYWKITNSIKDLLIKKDMVIY